jgi:outer membrane protein OmpA-like peptidoglycan-associated protein
MFTFARTLLAGLLAAGLAAGCTSTESPVREPAADTEAARAPAPPPTPAREPNAPVDAAAAELAADRQAEEAIERAPAAAPSLGEPGDGMLEVRFGSGTAELTVDARSRLDALYEELIARASDFYLDVQGHTDRTGSQAANRLIAELRAEAVRRYLHEIKGVPMERMGVTPLGSAVPVASNQTAYGRERNRRVVVVVLLPP